MKWADRRGIFMVLVGKLEEKRPLGIPRCRWEDDIKTDLQGSRLWGCGLDRAGLG